VPRPSQRLQMVLDRVATRAGDRRGFRNRHPAAFAAQFQDPCRELGEIAEDQPLALDLVLEPVGSGDILL